MEKKDAECKRRMLVLNQRVADGLPLGPIEYEAWRRWSGLPPSSSYSSGKRRKRKKRSKEALQVLFWCRSRSSFWCSVFSSVDDRPMMLDFMVGMDQEDTYAGGWFLFTAPRNWQSLVRCSPWFDSGYMLSQSTAAFVGGAFRIQRNAWFDSGFARCPLELFELSAMLGSTVAL